MSMNKLPSHFLFLFRSRIHRQSSWESGIFGRWFRGISRWVWRRTMTQPFCGCKHTLIVVEFSVVFYLSFQSNHFHSNMIHSESEFMLFVQLTIVLQTSYCCIDIFFSRFLTFVYVNKWKKITHWMAKRSLFDGDRQNREIKKRNCCYLPRVPAKGFKAKLELLWQEIFPFIHLKKVHKKRSN